MSATIKDVAQRAGVSTSTVSHVVNGTRYVSDGLRARISEVMQQLDFLQRRLVHPAQRMQQQAQHLERLHQRLLAVQAHGMQYRQWRWQSLQQRLRAARPDPLQLAAEHAGLGRRLKDSMRRTLERLDTHLNGLQQHLLHLDPQQVLARGYSMVRDEQGAIVSDSAGLQIGARLDITFARGWARAELQEKGEAG